MGFLNAMRFKYLGLMATFWVLSGVHGEDGQDKITGSNQVNAFNTAIENFTMDADEMMTKKYSLDITTSKAEHTANTTLFLCQATPPTGTNANVSLSAQKLGFFCLGSSNECTEKGRAIQNDVKIKLPFTLATGGGGTQSYFFLCFTNTDGLCASTSNGLALPGSHNDLSSLVSAGLPTDPKQLTSQFRPALSPSELTPKLIGDASSPGSTTTMIGATITTPPASSATAPAAEPTDTPTSAPNGLSTGAKAGIAVGALGVVVIILLGALLCLRKRHRRASAPDQIMLNQSSADSHDLITEKETERNSPQSYEAPTPVYGANLNVSPKSQTRHSALAPYEELPSQPYTGSAAAIPRRKPTLSPKSTSASSSANQATTAAVGVAETATGAIASSSKTPPAISREVSAASTIGPPSRTTPPTTNESSPPTRDFEEYRDIPTTYADRHTPQVFEGGLQAPFLGSESNVSRESMSEADLARLTEEEEERRIDAAIEEAERKRRP